MANAVIPDTLHYDHLVDSRRVARPTKTVFYCLPGKRRDGHQFISELYEAGVRHFVVSQEVEHLADAHYYHVDDVLETLQGKAAKHRREMNAQVVSITGSNGKTTIKEWLYQILKDTFSVYRSPASYNSQIGVALSLLGIRPHHELAIIEAGISKVGEMARLQHMIKPDYGIFSGIGSAHDAGFESREQKEREKRLLFKDVHFLIESSPDLPEISTYPYTDPASVINIQLILGFLQKWRPDLYPSLLPKINALHRVKMRSEVKRGLRNNIIISDYYNADLEGLQNSLRVATEVEPTLPKILIASELKELDDRSFWIQSMASLLGQQTLESCFLIGSFTPEEKELLQAHCPVHFVPTTIEMVQDKIIDSWSDCVIILKGARSFGFEQIERELIRPQHGTRLEIDMDALLSNWNALGHHLGNEVWRLAMIKATAYGSGLIRMGRFFSEHHADYLGVAYPDEGVLLRENGITTPILILNSDFHSLRILQKYDLEPVASSLDHLHLLDQNMDIKVHLELNTGMNRLGLDQSDIHKLKTLLKGERKWVVKSIMSHLSASDDESKDDISRSQVESFHQMSSEVMAHLKEKPVLHIANSHGAIRMPWARFDMVRLGIALYGGGNSGQISLSPVHRFMTQISQLRRVSKGQTVGYGANAAVERDSMIATVPVGYADGLPRILGRGKQSLWVNGYRAPIVGDVCMDMTMIDVTDVPNLVLGEEVEIFGTHIRLEEVARNAQTISYEILSGIGQRVSRVFLNG